MEIIIDFYALLKFTDLVLMLVVLEWFLYAMITLSLSPYMYNDPFALRKQEPQYLHAILDKSFMSLNSKTILAICTIMPTATRPILKHM